MALLAFACKHKAGDRISKLKRISAFTVDERLLPQFVRGQLSDCSDQPLSEVRIYPAFKSDKPLYGSIRLAEEYGQENSGILYHFAVDESQGMGKGYDQLHFDLNHDFDLTNDTAVRPLKNPPDGALLNYPSIKQQVCFNYLCVDFENGSAKQRPLEIMARLMIYDSGHANLAFVTTEARKGKIRISGQRYDVLLGHNYVVSGWFNRPWTALHLIPNGDMNKQLHWQGADRLMAVHKIEGTYYCFSATPAGDKLIVRPYEGELGTFMGGSGGRGITYIGCSGSLWSKDKTVAVGNELNNEWPQPSYSPQMPVGDYLPSSLTIQYDKLSIYLSNNYHADGKPLSRASVDKKYGIKIRENEPFVFDFSNEPEVMFASPAKDYRIKPGEQLTVKAVLIDPELDIMIRRLTDTSRKEKEEYDGPDDQKETRWIGVSLDPKVVITRADGQQVAEGVMPFG
jgi:hypothetical protein